MAEIEFHSLKHGYEILVQAMNFLEDQAEDLNVDESWEDSGIAIEGANFQIVWNYKEKVWALEEK